MNVDVNRINNILLQKTNKYGNTVQTYTALNVVCKEHAWNCDTNLLNRIENGNLPPNKLRLKIGVPIILLRTIDKSKKLCNGTRLIVVRLTNHLIQAIRLEDAMILGKNSPIHIIPRINCVDSNNTLHWNWYRKQFPIKICYCITINRSQGQSLKTVGMYLPQPVFAHGQLYVGCSRAQLADNLLFKFENVEYRNGKYKNKYITENIVYYEIISSYINNIKYDFI